MSISVAIMAAGFGTRMKSKTPKVLHSICGYPMLYHIIKEAKKISDDIHIIVYHEAKKIQEEMERYFEGLHFTLQDHENYPGTGGAIRNLNPKHKYTLVLNGDMPLLEASQLETFLQQDTKVLMTSFSTQNPTGYGRIIKNNDNIVTKIVEEKDASEAEKKVTSVNAGVYLFETNFLKENVVQLNNDNKQQEYYITDLIALANKKNIPVKSIEFDEEVLMGVNSKYHLSIAETIMQNRIKKRFMEAGAIMRLPESIYIDASVSIEGESVIENGVTLLGKTCIKNSHIKANSVVEDSTIEDSSIGPMARIRPKSFLQETHIGNFVEIKKSTLKGVKAGHLSYLGDAKIAEGTNIGCGTITCNYDGKAKYETIIGKNVFVGSDTQLIAPVKIEDDVIIASGTTVTKDIPKGSLAINRAPLKIVKEFFYKFFPNSKES